MAVGAFLANSLINASCTVLFDFFRAYANTQNTSSFLFPLMVFLFLKRKKKKHKILNCFYTYFENLWLFERELIELRNYKMISIFSGKPCLSIHSSSSDNLFFSTTIGFFFFGGILAEPTAPCRKSSHSANTKKTVVSWFENLLLLLILQESPRHEREIETQNYSRIFDSQKLQPVAAQMNTHRLRHFFID